MKNRPKIPSFYSGSEKEIRDEQWKHLVACYKWFDGFEKETREWLDCLTDFENHYDAGRKAVLRQVLGDEK